MNHQSALSKLKTPLAGAVVWLCLASSHTFAQTPQWWITRGVLNQNPPQDYTPVNQGQLKWLASNAYAEVSRTIGPDTSLTARINAFSTTNNYFPVNIGQVKHLAVPFYDRLYAFGLTNSLPAGMQGHYPWDGKTGTNDFAMANIGQAKYVFSFDLSVDMDHDALPDWWEIANFGGTNNCAPGDDPDGDGYTNLEEYQAGTVPTNPDTDPPTISIQTPVNGTRVIWVP